MDMASTLPEDLVQEILVRIPPDEPAHLVHASVVCKAWHRVVSDRAFLRRSRAFHGAPPVLGYVHIPHRDGASIWFFPTTASSVPAANCTDNVFAFALYCRHGRVLLHTTRNQLVVWDPLTGGQQHVSSMPSKDHPGNRHQGYYHYMGAMLCAKDDGGGGCDHLDCHGGPFRVVTVQNSHAGGGAVLTTASMYSSVTGAWSTPTSNGVYNRSSLYCLGGDDRYSLLIGCSLYFRFAPARPSRNSILKYDLCTHSLSAIDMPRDRDVFWGILMRAEDGGLGLATLSLKHHRICLWSRQDVTNGIGDGWVEHRVMELGELLPRPALGEPYRVIAFADGTNTIFVKIATGIFMLDLKSKKVRKVAERAADPTYRILPYVSFYTPREIDAN